MASPISSDLVRQAAKFAVRRGAMATAGWRVEPDVIIIGVKRGGTTSLFRDLELHPAMLPLVPSAKRLPLRENQKGVHFFDTGFAQGDRWYRSHFPMRRTAQRHRQAFGAAFTAEASPYYLFQPRAAARVAAALPTTRFVVMLRDPVERTISHWAEQTRNGVETLTLEAALDAEATRVGDDAERLAAGTLDVSHAHEQQSYAAQSEYANSLQRWFDAVGRDRVIVTFSETYYSEPAVVLDAVTNALGIASISPDVIGDRRNAAPRAATIDPDLERQLIERFRPDVERTAQLIEMVPPWPRFQLQDPVFSPDTTT